MVNIKSHYKMIIAIIIVVILVSSLSIYFYPHNDTEYYNNGKSVDVRYFNCESYEYCRNNSYNVSSYSINNNKVEYLNSTMMNVFYADVPGGNEFSFTMNMHIKGINARYVYVTVTGDNNTQYLETNVFAGSNATSYETSSDSSVIRINATENLNGYEFSISDMNAYVRNGVYNFTVKVSAGKLYNVFYIDTLKESAVYGTVGLKPECSDNNNDYDTSLNSTMFVYNNSTGRYNIVNIRDGRFYFFTVPGDLYKMYYLNNNNLTLFKYNDGKNITLINTPLKIESMQYNIYE
ncbi:MAG: hypothetical protein RE471_08820 [Ferroplasma sp.]|uniref:hypothetical protein n=1 Tax=Ferroplasma sp. TaxID=2591003 RepID=UPI00281523DA|nr:hypothetical protein [Ferroplasma sp.]WMT51066.1 MAG: hypothetical protein RE471_08820 [Ferroplasma sp.]